MSLFQINVSPVKSFKKNKSAAFYLAIVVGLIAIAIAGLIWLTRSKTPLSIFDNNIPTTNQHIQPVGKKIGTDSQGRAIYQVSANGIDIGYKLIGLGEPLVMIIGLGATMEDWPNEVLSQLSEKYQLILLDNRGMGKSTVNDTKFDYKLFADDVISLLDALGINKTNVLGFSMGSAITQELLLTYPQRFNKAIIYATTIDGGNTAKVLQGKVPDEPIVQRQIEATTHWKTPLNKLPLITNQVMLMVGTSDTVVGVESSKTLATAIPGAWLVQFKNATHFLVKEAPAEFSKTVINFLEVNETVSP